MLDETVQRTLDLVMHHEEMKQEQSWLGANRHRRGISKGYKQQGAVQTSKMAETPIEEKKMPPQRSPNSKPGRRQP